MTVRELLETATTDKLNSLFRSLPLQERAKESVDLIFNTTVELLEEVGIDGLNTNLIAERAGIRVRTIYRYFPNKIAIITAIYEEWKLRVLDLFAVVNTLEDPSNDWHEVLTYFFEQYCLMAEKQLGFVAIRRAAQATPELLEVDRRTRHVATELFVAVLQKKGVMLPDHQLKAISRLVVENIAAQGDLMCSGSCSYSDEIKIEFSSMLRCYLSEYLD